MNLLYSELENVALAAGLMDDISLKVILLIDNSTFPLSDNSRQVYDALAFHVTQANMNRRIKTVSLWSLQMTASAVLSTLRNLVDPMSTQFRGVYNGNGLTDVIQIGAIA